MKLTIKQSKLLALHKSEPDKFISDHESSEHLKSPYYSIRSLRTRLISAGHSFEYRTTVDTSTVKLSYRYAGKTGLGLICADDIYRPAPNEMLVDALIKLMANNSYAVLKAIIELNPRGYWEAEDVCTLTNLTLKQVDSAMHSFTRHLGMVFHRRGDPHRRQYLVTDVTGIKRDKTTPKKTTSHTSLLNGVFS